MNITTTQAITDTTRTGMRHAGKATARVGETLQRSGRIKTLPGQARRTSAAFAAGWRAGRRSRHVAQERAKPGLGVAAGAAQQRGGRESHGESDRAAGGAEGTAHQAIPRAADPTDPNDQTLEQRVQSEIFRDPEAPKGSVNVNVERGVVYLRGEVPERAWIERLVAGAGGVQGVKGVESLLHQPEEPAPKKE